MTLPDIRHADTRVSAGIETFFSLGSWLASNTLCSLGVLALATITIGSFTLSGTMLQLSNLANRFVAADPGRQTQFGHVLLAAFIVVFFTVGLLRRESARQALRSRKGS